MRFDFFIYLAARLLLCLFPVATVAENAKSLPAPSLAIAHQVIEETPREALPESLLVLLKKHKVPSDSLSIYIRDVNANQAMLEHNVDVLRAPASTLKLLTTYAALKQLGPNFSWRTEAWIRGEIKDGVLHGDLILKGYGDPFLVYERFWKFIRELRDRGLTEITGDVIVDNHYYDTPVHERAAFDGRGFRVYNAEPSPLMFNFQASRLMLKPPADDSATLADVTLFPPSDALDVDNQLTLVKGKCKRSHGRPELSWGEQKQLVVKGQFSLNCKPRYLMRLISAPTQHVYDAFRHFWQELGGTLHGELKQGRVSPDDVLFYSYASPTLGEQIRLINKWSNNVMTRQLLLTVGAKRFGAPATLEKGRKAIKELLEAQGVDTAGMIIDNGSGLSRKSRISARQMAQLLDVAFRDAYMPEFMSSMALPGIDGTLASRLKGSELKGRSHLKTGTLNYVTALSGYMLNRQGRRLIIVIQQNGPRASSARGGKIQDEILRWAFEQ
ncbi:MAG: D-alanyl-D-alanine carboxypeptidase/D-alanyl-D-alanine-endopeptidase [Proteobacteria bacterium]|nr:MAG: D-alanyl-D-alanine carboxypeptidase/D-alanyl-D-alanine-endopeptidase [Pseudomonadota bacterium]